MTLTSIAAHRAGRRALKAYDTSGVYPYAITERVLANGGDRHDAAEAAYEEMLDATGNTDAADRAAENAKQYAEELGD